MGGVVLGGVVLKPNLVISSWPKSKFRLELDLGRAYQLWKIPIRPSSNMFLSLNIRLKKFLKKIFQFFQDYFPIFSSLFSNFFKLTSKLTSS